MILAPTLSLNASSGSRVDADAAAFAATSGATDVAALSAFVKGVKALGLWNSMVAWPLRSSQNAGAGATVYGLGGLGTFNGTLLGAPARGEDGLTTVAGTNAIILNALAPVIRTANSFTCILVASNAAIGPINFGNLRGGGNNNTGDNYGVISRQFNVFTQSQIYLTGGNNQRNWGSTSFSASGNQFFAINRSDIADPVASDGSVVLNAAEFSNKSGTGNLPSTNPYAENFYVVGGGSAGHQWSFVAVVTPQSPTLVQSMRTLYKSTLGTGLGLP